MSIPVLQIRRLKEQIIMLADLEDSFDSQKRQDRRKFADLEQTLTQLQNQVKELHEEPEEGKKK